jgi:hypothetical protein
MVPIALAMQTTTRAEIAKRIELKSSTASATNGDWALSSRPEVEGPDESVPSRDAGV